MENNNDDEQEVHIECTPIEKLEKRFDNYMNIEEEHYIEYMNFYAMVNKFQENFPYNRLNWLGRFLLWFVCEKIK